MASETKQSVGQALDSVINALETLEESTRITVVKAACEHLNIPLIKGKPYFEVPTETENTQISSLQQTPTSNEKMMDIRTFKETKNPSNDIEMVCIMAYYLETHATGKDKKPTIQPKDIGKYFKQANFPLPKAPSQTLVNTKKAGYLDSAGRGKYKLNPVGYNLVAHSLPRGKKD